MRTMLWLKCVDANGSRQSLTYTRILNRMRTIQIQLEHSLCAQYMHTVSITTSIYIGFGTFFLSIRRCSLCDHL